MSTTVRICDIVEEYIKTFGKFGETHNDVFKRRLLDFEAFEASFNKTHQPSVEKDQTKRRVSRFTPQNEFRTPLLKVLLVAPNHRLKCSEALDKVGQMVQLKEADWEKHKGNETRWKNNVCWLRKALVEEGLLEPSKVSGVGIWQLTAKGVEAALKMVG